MTFAHKLFETQAAKTPDAIALTFGQRSLTYRQLEMEALCKAVGIPFDEGMAKPHDNAESKMVDGIYKDAASRQIGDPNFHKTKDIDAGAADAWKQQLSEDSFGEPTRNLARMFRY